MFRLQDQLDQITANTRNLVQPERLEISERAVAELYASGAEDRILPVGSIAPEFALPDAAGRIIKSADLLALAYHHTFGLDVVVTRWDKGAQTWTVMSQPTGIPLGR